MVTSIVGLSWTIMLIRNHNYFWTNADRVQTSRYLQN